MLLKIFFAFFIVSQKLIRANAAKTLPGLRPAKPTESNRKLNLTTTINSTLKHPEMIFEFFIGTEIRAPLDSVQSTALGFLGVIECSSGN